LRSVTGGFLEEVSNFLVTVTSKMKKYTVYKVYKKAPDPGSATLNRAEPHPSPHTT
jgi:hypothetical protein